jgi:GTPase Era involved in 16S rRNA processing
MATVSQGHAWLPAHLFEAQQVLEAMGSDFTGIKARMEELCGRLTQGRFRLAVLGQFKRGKSSLLNALLGEPLLPTGVLPLTAIPTIIRHGAERRVRLTLLDGQCEDHTGTAEHLARVLMRSVTERENPANRLGITQAEVEHPSHLLAGGLEIIDTPGIGSTVLHNTQTARAMLPVCDAALFILSPDPPITEVEVQFLRAVKDAVTRVIFVLMKTDLLTEPDRRETLTFLQQVLRDQAGFSNHERIFLISARQALEARAAGEAASESLSGMSELEAYLADFLMTEKRTALQEAIRTKAARLLSEALFAVDLQRKAIDLPRQELEQRAERFEAQLAKIDSARMYLGDRLSGDRLRIAYHLDQRAEALAPQARAALVACAKKVRETASHGGSPRQIDCQIRAAISEGVDRVFARAARSLLAEAAAHLKSVEDFHCREAEVLIDRIRRTAADLFEVPCLERVRLEGVEAIREPRVVSQRWITSFTEQAALWATWLLPHGWQIKRLERRLREDIDYLVTRNMEELRWATQQNLQDAIRAFQVRMETQLGETISTVRASVWAALEHQSRRELAHEPALQRLDAHRQRVMELLTALLPPKSRVLPGSPV